MKQIKANYRKGGHLHHAYALVGDRKKVKEELFSFLVKDLEFPVTNNPDLWYKEFNVFKIDDSRSLSESHLNKPVRHNRKVFIIFANFITKDAQNSLLKIFEEPKAETTFFLVLPAISGILPTLKSRIIVGKGEGKQDDVYSAEEFLASKIGKRLEIIAKIAKDIKDEKITKSDAITFIKNLEKIIKENWKVKKHNDDRGKSILAVEDIEKAISYANDESPSIKVILEHLALVL